MFFTIEGPSPTLSRVTGKPFHKRMEHNFDGFTDEEAENAVVRVFGEEALVPVMRVLYVWREEVRSAQASLLAIRSVQNRQWARWSSEAQYEFKELERKMYRAETIDANGKRFALTVREARNC